MKEETCENELTYRYEMKWQIKLSEANVRMEKDCRQLWTFRKPS